MTQRWRRSWLRCGFGSARMWPAPVASTGGRLPPATPTPRRRPAFDLGVLLEPLGDASRLRVSTSKRLMQGIVTQPLSPSRRKVFGGTSRVGGETRLVAHGCSASKPRLARGSHAAGPHTVVAARLRLARSSWSRCTLAR